MFRRALFVLGCAAIALPPAASGFSSPALQSAVFRIRIHGVQTTGWHKVTVSDGPGCPSTTTEFGSEALDFTSPRAEKADVFAFRYQPVLFVSQSGHDGHFRTDAIVTRNSYQDIELQGECSGLVPAPLVNDCGTKHVDPYELDLTVHPGAKTWVGIGPADGGVRDPFTACTAQGATFPDLLAQDTNGQPILVQIPKSLLFNPHIQVIVKRGGGDYSVTENGGTVTTRLRWQITLVRTRGHVGLIKGLHPK
jgi:hypothetical protein